MSNAYRQIYHSFFKEHVQSITRGQFWLDEYSNVTLGEPVILHPTLTGFVSTPKNKRRIQSYPAAAKAGAQHGFGISLDILYSLSGVSNDEKILRPDHYFPREIAVMQMGICKIINMSATGTTAAQIDETALPIAGGAVPISYGARHTGSGFKLGKWIEETRGGEAGLVFVDPKAEVIV